MNKKTTDVSSRLTPVEFTKRSMDSRLAAMEQALKGEKVQYKSNCDSEKFKEFLEDRLTIWEEEKDKTFYGKGMYEKTKTLIDNWN
jgi:tRNA splicing endonuclease